MQEHSPHQARGLLRWLMPWRPSPALAGRSPRYEPKREIGRGGMAVVREVIDHKLHRSIAMKVLDERHRDERGRAKFHEEAQITGQLDHPNIVPVHDYDVDEEGAPYITMQLVRGETLAAILRREPPEERPAERMRFFIEVLLKVCDALAFAHSRGVVHRDLKPQNIMVGEFGEVYLMDWGLASAQGRDLYDETRLVSTEPRGEHETQEGVVIGTIEYASPEQAWGRRNEIDERTDVFGLGAVLYHVLVGAPPYEGELFVDKLLKARDAAFVPVQERALVPSRLVEVCHRAMSAAKEDRFQSVAEMREALSGVLRGGLYLPMRSLPKGSVIVREGEEGHEGFVLLEGRCGVFRGSGPGRVRLGTLEAGDVFGEAAVFTRERRLATVEAETDVHVVVVTREALLEELGFDRWAGAFVQALARRFVKLSREGVEP